MPLPQTSETRLEFDPLEVKIVFNIKYVICGGEGVRQTNVPSSSYRTGKRLRN
jgi:hypothetical protein